MGGHKTVPIGRLDLRAATVTEVDERRRDPRVDIHVPLLIKLPSVEAVLESEALNVSKSGMFIAMREPAPVGSRLDVEVSLDDGKLLLHAVVEVMRQQFNVEPYGVGVRFVDVPFEASELIERMLADEKLFGAYRLEELLGRGGMAEVYRAKVLEGPYLGRRVALKRILPEHAQEAELQELFLREAALTRSLSHPNVIEVLEAGQIEGTYYMALDFIDGCDLRRIVAECRRRGVRLPVDFACFVALTVAEALAHVHEARDPDGQPLGIVHRDVAPSNVFISHFGEIKLGDFGVARDVRQGEDLLQWAGKDPYIAPEQIEGHAPTPAADVFSLAALLYELLTNELAFPGESRKETWRKIRRGEVRPPRELRPEISPALEAFVLRGLSPVLEGTQRGFLERLKGGAERPARFMTARAFADGLAPLFDPAIGTQMAIATVVRSFAPRGRGRRGST